ncbi:hypothetical protein ABTC89_19860, partial [Acinetobacter baumannii]
TRCASMAYIDFSSFDIKKRELSALVSYNSYYGKWVILYATENDVKEKIYLLFYNVLFNNC